MMPHTVSVHEYRDYASCLAQGSSRNVFPLSCYAALGLPLALSGDTVSVPTGPDLLVFAGIGLVVGTVAHVRDYEHAPTHNPIIAHLEERVEQMRTWRRTLPDKDTVYEAVDGHFRAYGGVSREAYDTLKDLYCVRNRIEREQSHMHYRHAVLNELGRASSFSDLDRRIHEQRIVRERWLERVYDEIASNVLEQRLGADHAIALSMRHLPYSFDDVRAFVEDNVVTERALARYMNTFSDLKRRVPKAF